VVTAALLATVIGCAATVATAGVLRHVEKRAQETVLIERGADA
jgi:hypothetical protein